MASKELVKRSYRNLEMYLMYKKQICGHNSNYLHMVPEPGLELLPHADILLSLRTIEASMLTVECSRHVIMDELKIILEQSSKSKSSAQLLSKYEGFKILFTVLCASGGTKCCDVEDCRFNYTIWDIKLLIVSIFQRVVSLDVSIAEDVCRSTEFLQVLFSLVGNVFTSSPAATLIEHLIIYRKGAFNLTTVPGLASLVNKFHGYSLASFCRILSFTISDSAVCVNQPYLWNQKELKDNSRQVIAFNQSFVLSIPGFLPRLVDCATGLPYKPRCEGISAEEDHWMWLLNSVTDTLGRWWSASPNVFESSTNLIHRIALSDVLEPVLHRQETLSVLGHLLNGELRQEVRAQLAGINFIPRLSELFDQFIWRCDGYHKRLRVPRHRGFCECSPEANLKVKFLRLLHDFCYQSEYKYLLLTPTEYQEICYFNVQANATLPPNKFPPELMCSGQQGLLSKIIETLKRENTGSSFRFWLSRVIENYLRWFTQFGEQMFMLRRGLLEHLVDLILEAELGPHHKALLQSAFDLLGELVKYNLEAFRRLDVWFTDSKRAEFLFLLQDNLVDSNLLVRYLVLSYAHFTSEESPSMQYPEESPTLSLVASFAERLSFLVGLLEIGRSCTLTQESISCLNTALVILIVGHCRLQLSKYLVELRSFNDGLLLSRLRSLLLFWEKRYSHGVRYKVLQMSSGLSFDLWQETVTTLVAENKSDPNCIIHYLTVDN